MILICPFQVEVFYGTLSEQKDCADELSSYLSASIWKANWCGPPINSIFRIYLPRDLRVMLIIREKYWKIRFSSPGLCKRSLKLHCCAKPWGWLFFVSITINIVSWQDGTDYAIVCILFKYMIRSRKAKIQILKMRSEIIKLTSRRPILI